MGKRWHLLVRRSPGVTGAYRRLLRRQSVRDHRVAVVKAVHVRIELTESSPDYRLRGRLPGKSEAWRQAQKLVRVLTRERESRIFPWLRVNLEVLAQAHFQR